MLSQALIISAVAIFFAFAQPNMKEEERYSITEFKKGSGIYYEHFGNLKLSSANWRVAVFVNVKKQNQDIDELKKKMENLSNSCSEYYKKQCLYHVNNYEWNGLWDSAMKLKNEVQNALNELSIVERHLPTRLPEGTRIRRRTPLLGFLGKIIAPVTGMLNDDDGDRINAAIRELNIAQANITHLVGKQTHVVRAQLDLLHKQGEIHSMELRNLKHTLDDLSRRNEISHIDNYTLVLDRVLHTIEKKVEHNLKTGAKMLDVIHAARKGQLHPALLTSQQLLPIIRDIKDSQANLGIPIRGPNYSIDELIEISHTSIVLEAEHLKILADIPLTVEPLFSIYKLHPFPVYQAIVGNKTGKAYIEYNNAYVVVDDSQLTYMTMGEEDFNACKKTFDYFLCQNAPVIYDTARNPSCDIQMLLEPYIKALKTCSVRLEYNDEPFWRRLETIGGWLYSVKAETTLNIKCLTKYKTTISIEGAGLLQLAPGSTARAKSITLPALQSWRGISEIIYETHVELNLINLSPILGQWNETAKESSTTLESKYYQNADTLDELEQQLNDLSIQRLEKSQKWWSPNIYVNYLLIAAGVVVITYYVYRLYCIIKKKKHLIPSSSTQKQIISDLVISTKDEVKLTSANNNKKNSDRITLSTLEKSGSRCQCTSLFDHGS